MTLDLIGWDSLTPKEQTAGFSGGMIGGGIVMGYYALLWIPRKLKAQRRREPSRRIRHRPPSRPATPKRKRRKGKGKPRGRR